VQEKKRDELREKALDREKRFFVALPHRGRDWVAFGTTKAGINNQLKRDPLHAHE